MEDDGENDKRGRMKTPTAGVPQQPTTPHPVNPCLLSVHPCRKYTLQIMALTTHAVGEKA